MMSRATSTADRQRAVWRISAALADARLGDHDAAVRAALRYAGEAVGVPAVALWETDLIAWTTRQIDVWMAPGAPPVVRDDVVRPVADGVVEQMADNEGLAVLPIAVLAGGTPIAEEWANGTGALGLIDLDDAVARTVSVMTPEPSFDDEQMHLVHGVATILRQYFARVRSERVLEQRLDLAAFTSQAVARLGAATEETIDAVVRTVLAELVERTGVRSALVYRVGTERSVVVHNAGADEDPAWNSVPRVHSNPDSESGVPWTMDLLRLAVAHFGADQLVVAADDTTRATLVPTEVDDGRVRKTMCLVHEPREWSRAELEAFTLISASITQNRSRAEAVQESAYRESVQSEFAAVASEFLRAVPDNVGTIVTDAVGRICERLGASVGTIFRFGSADATDAEIVSVWSAGAAPYAPGDMVPPAEPDMPDLLRRGESFARVLPLTPGLVPELRHLVRAEGEHVWTVLASPLSGGPNPSAFAVALPGDHSHRFDTLFELMAAFCDMLSQLRARIRLELAVDRDAAAQSLLRTSSAILAERSADDFDTGVRTVLAQTAALFGLAEISSWQIDEAAERYVVRHAVHDAPSVGTTVDFGADAIADAARQSGDACCRRDEAVPGAPERFAVARGDGVRRSVLVARGRDVELPAATMRFLAELSDLLGRFEERLAAQRYSQSAFGAAPIGIVLSDADGTIVQCNPAFADFVAQDSPFDLVGRPLHEVIPVEAADAVDEPCEFSFQRWDRIRTWGTVRATAIESAMTGEQLWLMHVEDISERRRADQLLRHQATHDELTGLANRRVLAERTEAALADEARPAILLLDLDRFKTINDSLGHDRGDELLIAIADRLRLAVRPNDLVVRLGGDEFAVLVAGPVDEVDARRLADRLQGVLAAPLRLAGQDLFPSASIGIAVADAPTTVADMLRRADTAMYRAKSEGRGRHATFDDEMREQVTERLSIEAGLRRALDGNELTVHFQPEVSLPDGRIVGAEALVRWEHPERGLLPAGAFIAVAEETGFVTEIGEFVLRAACREAVTWPDPTALLRVNFAAAQLQRSGTVTLVRDVLEQTGLQPERLCIEITESAMMEDVSQAEDVLHRLRRLGVQIAVDDFGTGFSSLAYLKRFPVDTLKIDRTFVDGLDGADSDDTFVRSIISLAEALELEVVGEGVENQAQADALVALGCRRAQGYFFGRPMPADDLRCEIAASV